MCVGDVLVVTGLFGCCWDLFSSVRLMPHRVLDVGCSCDTNRHETEPSQERGRVCDIYSATTLLLWDASFSESAGLRGEQEVVAVVTGVLLAEEET